MKTLEEEVYDWLTTTFAIDPNKMYMSRMPDTKTIGEGYWLIYVSGDFEYQLSTHGKTYLHSFILHYRHKEASKVDKEIARISRGINAMSCFSLPDYEVVWVRANSFSHNEGTDEEDFYRGSVTIQIRELHSYEED